MNQGLSSAGPAPSRRRSILRPAALAALGLTGVVGCAQQQGPRPLTADAFVARQGDGNSAHVVQSVDPQPPLVYNDVHVPLLPEDQRSTGDEVTGVSPVTEQSVPAPDRQPAGATGGTQSVDLTHANPAAPTTQPTQSFAGGQYQELGCVLAIVNGTPIYAHKVLNSLENALAAEARRSDPRTFRITARKLVTDQLTDFVKSEVVFAAAQRNLTERERAVAQMVTMQHRDRLVTEAGGAIEVARRKAADEGLNFDEQLQEAYRVYMARVYYEKKIIPRIFVSPTDRLRFYEANKATLYTEQGGIKFRLVQIDPAKYPGGEDQARDKAENVRRRAQAEDFGKLAAAMNDNKGWARAEGHVGSADQGWWVQKGAFALEKVEAAVWNLRPGQVSQVIKDRGGFYVARLEERRENTVKPYVDLEVQKDIEARLRREQFEALQRRHMTELFKNAIVYQDPRMIEVALDMAMQRYPRWAESASAQ